MRTTIQKIERFTIYCSPDELEAVSDFLWKQSAITIDRFPTFYEGDMEKVLEFKIIAERIISQ